MGRVALGAWLMVFALAPPVSALHVPFGFKDVYAIAHQFAQQPYQTPERRVPEFLTQLTYDQYRDIRFKPRRALWRDAHLPFQVQFFLPGYIFNRPVTVNVVDTHGVHRVAFSRDLFNFGANHLPEAPPATLGFAGFRLHYPINVPATEDEFAVFLGASYFRAIGKSQTYGLSGRGVVIHASERGGEEFPAFTEFWLRTPGASARAVTIYALLDGPSVTGAYQFDVTPGGPTRMDVTAAIFLRRRVALLGVAPLSSMFFHGTNTIRSTGDFRPEVHDSDGLLLASSAGEWIWRPLVNPSGILMSSFSLAGLRGFGLMQRDRAFDHYQDLQARYDTRPSAWIVPHDDWGEGQVRLLEFPTGDEYTDNIVAMWVPAQQPASGTPLRLAYHILWGTEDRRLPPSPGGHALATRIGSARSPDGSATGPLQVFVVDFAGGTLNALPPAANVKAVLSAGPGGKIVEQHLEKNPVTGGWRVSFRLLFTGKSPVELRGFLRHGSDALTETWSYLAPP